MSYSSIESYEEYCGLFLSEEITKAQRIALAMAEVLNPSWIVNPRPLFKDNIIHMVGFIPWPRSSVEAAVKSWGGKMSQGTGLNRNTNVIVYGEVHNMRHQQSIDEIKQQALYYGRAIEIPVHQMESFMRNMNHGCNARMEN